MQLTSVVLEWNVLLLETREITDTMSLVRHDGRRTEQCTHDCNCDRELHGQ